MTDKKRIRLLTRLQVVEDALARLCDDLPDEELVVALANARAVRVSLEVPYGE